MRFRDKVVLVTGSSKGIGKATALAFAKEGAKIVVNYYKSEHEAKNVVNAIKEIGSDAIAIQCDVSKENEVKEMIQKIISTFNKIDILVNNAGIVFDVSFKERTVEQWKRTLEVNLMGVFLCCKYAAPYMKMKNGKIVNISSNNGINGGGPYSMDYDASKAGLISLTNNLAEELAPYIQVNSVAPGWITTEMNKDLPKDLIENEIKKTLLRRFGNPEEIANVVLFLCSDDASFMTGSIVRVDGGYK